MMNEKLQPNKTGMIGDPAAPDAPGASDAKVPSVKKVKRPRRVFQCGDPDVVRQVVLVNHSGWEKDGVQHSAVTRTVSRNEAYCFVIDEPVLESDYQVYDLMVEAMRRFCASVNGRVQEVGPDAENKIPDFAQKDTSEAMKQRLALAEAAKSDLTSQTGKLQEDVAGKEGRISELERQLEAQKKLLAELAARNK